jgi:hypothetical protein
VLALQYSRSAFLPCRRRILASGRRVEVRRSRSHATRPQGATSTRRLRAGQWIAEEEGAVQHPLGGRVSLTDQQRAEDVRAGARPAGPPQG